MQLDQKKTPFFTKIKEYAESNSVALDVPGHKRTAMLTDMVDYVGIETFKLDANAPRGLDNLSRPVGVIKEASKLLAEAFLAEEAYFLTGGTTMGILAMIMSICRAKEKIILPRNVHKSVINALIFSGAIPVFIKPRIDMTLGIANDMPIEEVKKAIEEHPDAKAVFVINPTYFGAISDLKEIVEVAHQKNMLVLADEAHGAHYCFSEDLPYSAMEAGVDLSAASMHKTGGSLTQSSILLAQGPLVDHQRLKSTINLLQSTSPSSLFLASIDVARKVMYFEAPKKIPGLIKLASETRKRIQKIPGLQSLGKEYFTSKNVFDYDESKIIVKVSDLGVTGFDVYKELYDEHKIQMELAETHLILAVLSIATTQEDMDRFVKALESISEKYAPMKLNPVKPKIRYSEPEYAIRPREAYHAPKAYMPLIEAVNQIAAESIMIYPPGIPIVIPGEVITQDIIDDLQFYKTTETTILSDSESDLIKVVDKELWFKWEGDDDEI